MRRPVQVRGMGLRLSDEIPPEQVNFGHLQVLFEDGSIGWYEAGWGPMISETAFFVKDVMSPKGSVSIVMDEGAKSADIDTHTKTATIRLHRATLDADGPIRAPGRACSRCRTSPAIRRSATASRTFVSEGDRRGRRPDAAHERRHPQSLEVVLVADRSMRERRAIDL